MKKKAIAPPPELEPLIRDYARAYPGVTAFIVTSDRLVFLPRQSGEAAEHQKALNRARPGTIQATAPAIQIYKQPATAGKNK